MPTSVDREAYEALKNTPPSVGTHPNTFAWFVLCHRFTDAARATWAGAAPAAPAKAAKAAPAKEAPKKEEPKKEEPKKAAKADDDEMDLFGDDDEEDQVSR